jgi:hypothetical protein
VTVPPLKADSVSVVIRGRFAPEELSPKRLLERGLLGPVEAADAEFEMLIPGQVSVYEAGWVRCQFQSDSLQISTSSEPDFERLRDLAVGILLSLTNAKVSMMGINRSVHFEVNDPVKWHTVGDRLANNGLWEGVLRLAGMKSLTSWGARSDNYWGHIQVQTEPSNIFPCSVSVADNDHFDLTEIDSQPQTRQEIIELNRLESTEESSEKVPVAVKILSEEWANATKRSDTVIVRIAEQAGG